MLQLTLNGSPLVTSSVTLTLLELLQQQQLSEKKGIAVAVNNQVVPKAQWKATALQNKDNVLVIEATQGG